MHGKSGVFVGKTLDDAVKKGLETLGLSRAAVMITVLEEGSGGFLGIGARPYKVRMAPRPRREMVEEGGRRDREGRGGREGRGEREHDRRSRRGSGGGGRGESRGGERGRSAGGRESGRRGGTGRGERAPGRREDAPVRSEAPAEREATGRSEAPRPRRDDERGGRRRRRGGRGRADGADMPASREAGNHGAALSEEGPRRPMERPERAPHQGESHTETPGMGAEQLRATAIERTETLLRTMGFEATVSAHADGDSVEVKAEVPRDGDLLVGPKGEVRQALQHLLNRMINRDQASRYHLQLEVNDFWHQREEELRDLAVRLADQAVADGREVVTEYLNAQERRIVHVSLKEDSRVRTHAIGEGLIKKISIAPVGAEEASEAVKPVE